MKAIFLFFAWFICIISNAQEKIDPTIIEKIQHEAFNNSKVMNTAFYLTDVSGPRLAGSPGWNRAVNWAKDQLTKWGLQNIVLEKWGEFGKGWELQRNYLAMTSPYYQALSALPVAYTKGTPGKIPIKGEVILLNPKDTNELKQYVGKLRNKIVLTGVDRPTPPVVSFQPTAYRLDDKTLEARKDKDYWIKQRRPMSDSLKQAIQQRSTLQREVNKLIRAEQPALLLELGGSVNGNVYADGGSGYKKDEAEELNRVMVGYEDCQRIKRLITAGVPVTIEADIKTKFFDADLNGYNLIAEIPGTDALLKGEVVMLGAHLDSWHGGTGATDNAAGNAVMLEVIRILKAIDVMPRRTIRLVLWNAEEQGTLGSEAYVKNHFADVTNMKLKAEHSKISAYYNLDNGTGKVRGIYTNGNDSARQIFDQWLSSFKEMGATTATLLATGGTDHDAFDAVGIPGFQFIQDPIEYSTKTHHTNFDTYDHLLSEDLKHSAMIVAAFVYQSAQRNGMIPRKELPKSKPSGN